MHINFPRFRFYWPVEDVSAGLGLLKAYLAAFSVADPVSLVMDVRGRLEVPVLEALVAEACRSVGLDPDGAFADIEIRMDSTGSDDLISHLQAFEALVSETDLASAYATAAGSLSLPILIQPTAAELRAAAADWDPEAIDIVLLTHNRLNYLRQTVEALATQTQHPHRLTVVDNASDPDVRAYLAEHRERFHRVVLNVENRWTEAFTQGIALTRSDPFVVSDPDILVPALTPCWLSQMKLLMDVHPEMGMLALNLDPTNKPTNLPDVYISEKTPYGMDITLSNVGTVMQTIRRRFFTPPYTTDWQTVEAIRANGGLVGFANHVVGYHLGWDEERDYPEHLIQKYRYFNQNYGSELYQRYTEDPAILAAMRGEAAPAQGPIASIVVLTYNQLEYSLRCIDSVLRHTNVPFELIVIDNASSDGTPDYLRELATQHPNVKICLNEQNRGFAGGCNQGMAIAEGPYVVLLNNDTVVGPEWLSRMIEVAQLEDVGLVGPRTNCIIGPQQVEGIGYDPITLDGFEPFTRRWLKENYRQVWVSPRVIGFCVLIRREVLNRIGGLDTRYKTGNYEDDDFCARARLAGFQIMVTDEVFIHHFGSVTFRNQNIDYRKLMLENWQRFKDKWLLPEDQRPEDGYRFVDVMSLPFDPALHTEPLFSRRIEPATLPDRSGFNLVACPPDAATLAEVIDAYTQAFRESENVTLHILAGARLPEAQAFVLKVLEDRGLDPEHIPTISLLDEPAAPLGLPCYLKAADLVLGSSQVLQGARDMGIPALEPISPEALREAERRHRLTEAVS